MTSFLVSGIVATGPELVGGHYEDADGTQYLPMIRQPVLVLEGPAELLSTARTRALERSLTPSVFTAELFSTPATCRTGLPSAPSRVPTSTWSGSPSTARRTPSTRS